MGSKIFKKSRSKISNSSKIFVKNSFEVINRIHDLMKKNGGLTQKELAKKLGKTESEVSKILSPGHNLTLKTISKIEAVLEEKIIFPEREKTITHTIVYSRLNSTDKAGRINHILATKKRKMVSSI